jgi:hypothetical protein
MSILDKTTAAMDIASGMGAKKRMHHLFEAQTQNVHGAILPREHFTGLGVWLFLHRFPGGAARRTEAAAA